MGFWVQGSEVQVFILSWARVMGCAQEGQAHGGAAWKRDDRTSKPEVVGPSLGFRV